MTQLMLHLLIAVCLLPAVAYGGEESRQPLGNQAVDPRRSPRIAANIVKLAERLRQR